MQETVWELKKVSVDKNKRFFELFHPCEGKTHLK